MDWACRQPTVLAPNVIKVCRNHSSSLIFSDAAVNGTTALCAVLTDILSAPLRASLTHFRRYIHQFELADQRARWTGNDMALVLVSSQCNVAQITKGVGIMAFLPDEIRIILRPRRLLVWVFFSPLVVLFGWWIWSWPWGSNNAPAWGQAVGSIGAILVAVAIPACQRSADRRERINEGHRENHQVARVKLKMLIEAKLLVEEWGRIRISTSHDPLWHNPDWYRDRIGLLLTRLGNAVAIERNDDWWEAFIEVQDLFTTLHVGLSELDIRDQRLVRMAEYCGVRLGELAEEIEDYLLRLESRYPNVFKQKALTPYDESAPGNNAA